MSPVLSISAVRRQFGGLRPLRVQSLAIEPGERVALSGFDAGAAEVLVNLVTGASLPDEGTVEVNGKATTSIADGEAWLAWLDQFGIVSPRAVLLDAATLLQNLAMPLSLAIEPIPPAIAEQAIALASEAGLDGAELDRPIAGLSPLTRARAHLARAIALRPSLLILEHPTIGFGPGDAKALGETVARVAAARSLATLMITQDEDLAAAADAKRFALHAASGELKPVRRRFLGF